MSVKYYGKGAAWKNFKAWLRWDVCYKSYIGFIRFRRWSKDEAKAILMRSERCYCPRRDESHFGDTKRKLPDVFVPTCTYCGSISPKRFFELVEEGAEIIPTDKNYKAYVRHESFEHGETKFYFQHFSQEDKQRFIQMLNDGKMKIGYPGYFYRLPFFAKRIEE